MDGSCQAIGVGRATAVSADPGGRSSSATAAGSRTGSIGCGTAPSARDQVASQASSGRPVSTRIGGQRRISSLSWRHRPMPPGTASPSRIARSIPPASIAVITAGWVATSSTRTWRQIGGDPATQREPDVLPGRPVRGVQQDRQHLLVAHVPSLVCSLIVSSSRRPSRCLALGAIRS